MPKVQLEAAWIYSGTTYGPGEADLPPDAHEAIGKKGGFPYTEPVAAAEPVTPQGSDQAAAENTPPQDPPVVANPIAKAVGEEVAANLREAGYGDLAAIKSASEADLLKVKGVGEAKAKALKALAAGE